MLAEKYFQKIGTICDQQSEHSRYDWLDIDNFWRVIIFIAYSSDGIITLNLHLVQNHVSEYFPNLAKNDSQNLYS